jgi:Na+-driven multidrug efflux pump
MLFADSEGYLNQASKMVLIVNAAAPLASIRLNAQAMLQTLQRGGRAMLLSFLNNFIFISCIAVIMYYTGKDNPPRVLWCYPASYFCAIPVSVAFMVRPFWEMWKLMKKEGMEGEIPLENLEQPLAGEESRFMDKDSMSESASLELPQEV